MSAPILTDEAEGAGNETGTASNDDEQMAELARGQVRTSFRLMSHGVRDT
jgi:hypothetical protein